MGNKKKILTIYGDKLMKNYDDIINRTKRNYTKISYGKSLLKNVDKVYTSYRIPHSENIVAALKTGISLFEFNGIIITNQAIYFSQHKDDRIPYDELCKYVVYMKDEKDNAMIATANKYRSITPPTLISKNIPGSEICICIRDIQKELIKEFSWAKEQREALVNEFCEKVDEIKFGELPEYVLYSLCELRHEEYFCNKSVVAESELYFLRNGEENYISFIKKLPPNVSDEVKTKLLDSVTELKEKMIKGLSDIDLIIADKYLETLFSSVRTWKNTDRLTALAKCYMFIRYKDMTGFNKELSNSKNILSQDEIADLNLFKGCYLNHSMINVYNTIKDGNVPTDEMCELYDSFGLTALHYALILQKNDIAETLIENHDWECYDFFDNESGINRFLDYKFVSVLLNQPCAKYIIIKTTDVIQAQLKTIKSYNRQIKLKEGLNFLCEKNISGIKAQMNIAKKNGDYNRAQALAEEIYRVKEIINQRHEEIRRLYSDIDEINSEIQNIISNYISDTESKINGIKSKKNRFIDFMISIFESPDYLLKLISANQEDSANYSFKGFEFTTMSSLDINFDDEDIIFDADDNEQENQESIQPLYGDSWFSPEAHTDIKILSSEYRILAKKYHPDICKYSNANRIFIEIANERAEIIENME